MDKGLVIAASGPASSPDAGFIAVLLRGATEISGRSRENDVVGGARAKRKCPALPSVVAATEHMDPGAKALKSQPPYGLWSEVTASITTADDVACDGEQAEAV
jgi:hypothetical protein